MSIKSSLRDTEQIKSCPKGSFIPYGRQYVDEEDIEAVAEVLRSNWITTGPKVSEFEQAVAGFVGAKEAVALSSGTAALHAAMYASGIGSGDEVILPPMTFAATANCVVFQGGTPVFTDVDSETLLIDPKKVEEKISQRTKAIIGVDYTGNPCDWESLRQIADRYKLTLIDDGCHALGAEYKGRKIGSLADMTVFSFHPVKHIATGEGGMVTTDNRAYGEKIKRFRNHGISTDVRHREKSGSWYYEMIDLGFNYRITDIQCALGLSQLKKLTGFLRRRKEIAGQYHEAFTGTQTVTPLAVTADAIHAYHLYVVRVRARNGMKRDKIFDKLRESGIGVNVHYIPIHLHPYYQQTFGCTHGLCPTAEAAYSEILSLPIYPKLNDVDVERVISEIFTILYHE